MLYLKNPHRAIKHLIVIPIVTTLIIPLALLDFWAEIYHRIAFPLYRFPYLKRREYIKLDRHKLKYLSFWEKGYCMYCSYGNGVINYWLRMAGETERYWCGIKHAADPRFHEPAHQQKFAEYGNEEDFKRKYKS